LSQPETNLKETPLHEIHMKYQGRMVDFGGWNLPIQYSGIINEHDAVRNRAGIFDVSHMGEFTIAGEQSLALLQELLTNDVSLVADNQVQYSPMCNDHGGIIDDLMVYRYNQEKYMLVVNAANTEKDFQRVQEVASGYPGVKITDISDQTALIALQGPLAAQIIATETETDLPSLKPFRFVTDMFLCGEKVMVSRTGYTGEDGYEIYCSAESTLFIWEMLMQRGKNLGLLPAGLGARDTLRFEACLPLYGNELDEDTNPLEAGLHRFVKLNKPDFRGKDSIVKANDAGLKKTLVGLEMIGRGVPRHGYAVVHEDTPIGHITTGSYAPTLDKNLGLAYVSPGFAAPGTQVFVDIRGRKIEAQVVPIPFYSRRRK
jgi:aminomethyltransferase